jgi:hypothetical protein
LQLQSNGVTALSTSGANVTIAGTLTTASQSIAKASLPTGTVLQVVYNFTTTAFVLTTSTLTDIVSATITPTSATSKILLFATFAAVGKSGVNAEGFFAVYKNGSALLNPIDGITPYNGTTTTASAGTVSSEYLDSPASTSALTYVMRAKDDQSGGVRINWEGGVTSITLMEIAA